MYLSIVFYRFLDSTRCFAHEGSKSREVTGTQIWELTKITPNLMENSTHVHPSSELEAITKAPKHIVVAEKNTVKPPNQETALKPVLA